MFLNKKENWWSREKKSYLISIPCNRTGGEGGETFWNQSIISCCRSFWLMQSINIVISNSLHSSKEKENERDRKMATLENN
jgi:hypothetical protein